jgi:hypothetical protein
VHFGCALGRFVSDVFWGVDCCRQQGNTIRIDTSTMNARG